MSPPSFQFYYKYYLRGIHIYLCTPSYLNIHEIMNKPAPAPLVFTHRQSTYQNNYN